MRVPAFFRYFLWAMLSFFCSLSLFLLACFYFVDPNRLRTPLEHFLNQDPTIQVQFGALSWKALPLLGLRTEDLKILMQGQSIHIKALELYPDLTALFKRRLVAFHKISVINPTANLKVSKLTAKRINKAPTPIAPQDHSFSPRSKLLVERILLENGNFIFEQSSGTQLSLTQLQLEASLSPQNNTLSCTAKTFGGDLKLNAKQASLSQDILFNLELEDFSLEQLLGVHTNFGLSGRADLSLQGQMPLQSTDLRQNFIADLNLKAQKSQLLGVDIPYYLSLAQSNLFYQLKPSGSAKPHTELEAFEINWHCARGLCHSNDLTANAAPIVIRGQGEISLLSEPSIDYRLQAIVEPQKDKNLSLFVKIHGPLNSPNISPDLEAYTAAYGKQLVDKALKKLKEKPHKLLEQFLSQ